MAWWLAYEELYGNMDEEYPIMKKTEDESEVTSASDDLVTADLPTGNYYGAETVPFDWGAGKDSVYFTGDIEFRTDGYPGSMSAISSTIFDSGPDVIKFGNDSALGVDSIFDGDITDNNSFSWKEHTYVGRDTPLYTYDKYSRSSTFKIMIPSFTASETIKN